ncbi:hypothetical protein [Coralloluteibacterium stylophorae]|uniref:Uncharacterized protein n=2 Tax=Coralloluteibacterium stylophorae TaxID=1776034 RepID=A0AAP2G2F9_9GAMM|nr:hypothetical protein [Coralloluteibacterium stylophorae]MBS7458821.1 hypothetical protein [Coralloluteibacterium stylophorae]
MSRQLSVRSRATAALRASAATAAPDPRLARSLVQWLLLGLAALAFVPAARGATGIGWLPFWCLVAPLLSLTVLYRHRLAAACGALLVARPRRRRGDQARRLAPVRRAGLRPRQGGLGKAGTGNREPGLVAQR